MILAGILGVVHSARYGPGQSRVEAFLLSALKGATQVRYQHGLQLLNRELASRDLRWYDMDEAEQDLFLSEWLVEGYEEGLSRSDFGALLSALGRLNPRVRYKTAWKVYDTWGVLQPPQQAPAAPPELITAMMVASFAIGRAELAMVICLCYSALLRVGESLQLTFKDVFFSGGSLVLCLARTKRGMEQKVVLTNTIVVTWMSRFLALVTPEAPDARIFSMSYASVLRWVKRLSALLGAESIQLTTHSFRRSGASELARRNVPFSDIMLFGRWLSDRSAREYIRKGEVAVLVSAADRVRWAQWCQVIPFVWHLQTAILAADVEIASQRQVTQGSFDNLERLVFKLFQLQHI